MNRTSPSVYVLCALFVLFVCAKACKEDEAKPVPASVAASPSSRLTVMAEGPHPIRIRSLAFIQPRPDVECLVLVDQMNNASLSCWKAAAKEGRLP